MGNEKRISKSVNQMSKMFSEFSFSTKPTIKMESDFLELMKNKFPLHANRIEYLYKENEDFRVLCADYYACTESLKKYRKSISDSESGLSDFEAAISDLEKELYFFIF